MSLVKKFTYNTIVDYLHHARQDIYWVSPSLTVEIAYLLKELADSGIHVSVITDIAPERYRNYEGELSAVEEMMDNPNLELKKAKDLGIGFVIVDQHGYAFFNPHRSYEQDGDRYNAIRLDEKSVENLISQFFDTTKQVKDLFELSESEQLQKDLQIEKLENKDIEKTKKELEIDPPLDLNKKKLINVYQAYFQIVEMKFIGSNLHIKKVKLPPDALPFSDAQLKDNIDSQLKLFREISEKDFFKPYFELKNNYDELREKYFTYIKTREKNIIRKKDKPAFEKEYEYLSKQANEIKKELTASLQKEIIATTQAIKESLISFFEINKPEACEDLTGIDLKHCADQEASKIVSKLKFPTAKNLLERLGIKKYYYDLTWEDLNNDDVIKEFKNKGLLNEDELPDIKKTTRAYEV